MDRQTDGGDCNIPDAFLKKRGDKNANNRWHFKIYKHDKFHAQLRRKNVL